MEDGKGKRERRWEGRGTGRGRENRRNEVRREKVRKRRKSGGGEIMAMTGKKKSKYQDSKIISEVKEKHLSKRKKNWSLVRHQWSESH